MNQAPTDLQLEVDDDGSVVTVRVIGELDISNVEQLRACFFEIFDSGRRQVVADLAELDFMDSTGLGVMVAGLKRFRSDGGRLVVQNPAPRVRKIFELTMLDREFHIT
jgi:anti-sigma B factor antagonist